MLESNAMNIASGGEHNQYFANQPLPPLSSLPQIKDDDQRYAVTMPDSPSWSPASAPLHSHSHLHHTQHASSWYNTPPHTRSYNPTTTDWPPMPQILPHCAYSNSFYAHDARAYYTYAPNYIAPTPEPSDHGDAAAPLGHSSESDRSQYAMLASGGGGQLTGSMMVPETAAGALSPVDAKPQLADVPVTTAGQSSLKSSCSDDDSVGAGQSHRPQPARSPYEWIKKSAYAPAQPAPGKLSHLAGQRPMLTSAPPTIIGKTRTRDKYRVVYSDHQRTELEKEFLYSRYITIRKKSELAAGLGLSERQVTSAECGRS